MPDKKNRNAGIGCVEIILILLVLIIFVMVFREQITDAVHWMYIFILSLAGTSR